MSDDKRVWMYRKGEAKIFDSADAVPAGEGWRETPAPDDPKPEPKQKITRDEYVKLDGEADDNGS